MYQMSFYAVCALIFFGVLFAFLKKDPNLEKNPGIISVTEKDSRKIFQLYDPEMAQGPDKDLVMLGYHIMQETKKLLPNNVGGTLNCVNCHFAAGNNFGGARNGLSLVGVVHLYPKISDSGEQFTLAQRINNCFMRSMNGTRLDLESREMKALLTYMEWISKDIPKQATYPWLGTKEMRTDHVPDPKNGKKIYELRCAMCHKSDGSGQERPDDLSYPPLWGENSFNDGAGMNKLPMISYFAYKNMPYEDPCLSIEGALDVGAYIIQQPRPRFVPPQD